MQTKEDKNFIEQLRRMRIKFRRENVVVLTNMRIPLYVIFIASLGQKFSYYAKKEDTTLNGYLIMFEKAKERLKDVASMLYFQRSIDEFVKRYQLDCFCNRKRAQTDAQEFIYLLKEKAVLFLKMNESIIVISADKGGRTVITDRVSYDSKMTDHLDDNVKKGIYRRLKGVSFNVIRELCESKYELIRKEVNEAFIADETRKYEYTCRSLMFDPFIISKIYGCLKIHKEGFPIRPIISAVNCMGKPLSDWLLRQLNLIASHVNKNQIRSAGELVDQISDLRLNKGHVLVTWDFDSMFTNIPFDKTKDIVRKYYYLVQGQTTMSCELFLKCLSFVVEDTAFFTFNRGPGEFSS